MIKVINLSDETKEALQRFVKFLISPDAEIIFVGVDGLQRISDDLDKVECPVIFLSILPEFSLWKEGNIALPYIYRKNGALFKMPSELSDVVEMYHKICRGEKIENPAAILVAQKKSDSHLVSILLHDIYPGKENCEKSLETARYKFGITGSIEEVRVQLEELEKQQKTKKSVVLSKDTLPGVFCDIEGTLIIDGKINSELVPTLKQNALTKPVSLWTGGDISGLEKFPISGYPILSKYEFEGCRVEIVIDNLSKEEFEQEYGIFADVYIQQK